MSEPWPGSKMSSPAPPKRKSSPSVPMCWSLMSPSQGRMHEFNYRPRRSDYKLGLRDKTSTFVLGGLVYLCTLQEVGSLFGNRDHRRVDVAGRHRGHHGGIDHAQVVDAFDSELLVDDSADAAGRSRMEHRLAHLAAVSEP